MSGSHDPIDSSLFAQHRYMNLTTFRKSGEAVVTPVWFAIRGDKLYVYTGAASGKIKRIRNNGAVQVQPSNASGKPRGPVVSGQARILAGAEAQQADTLITQRYGWQKKLIAWANRFRNRIGDPIFIEIQLGK